MDKLHFTKQQVVDLIGFCRKHNLDTFFLAKDQGVYIGAAVGSHEDSSFKDCIQYAEGCNPNQNEAVHGDWYENSSQLCGGDDFGEYLEVSILDDIMNRQNWTKFSVTLTQTELSFSIS